MKLAAIVRATLALLCLAVTAWTQVNTGALPAGGQPVDPRSFVRIQLPPDSPVELVRVDYGGSRVVRSDREVHFDLDLKLILRNRSAKPVEGLAVGLGYAYGSPGGEGLNAASGIRLRPGESFELPAHMRGNVEVPPPGSRGRPVDLPGSAQLNLDVVLFQDGSAYGPDRLGMLSPLRINQAEAARDRRFLETLAARGGPGSLVRELERLAAVWQRQSEISPRTLAGPRAELLRSHAVTSPVEVVRLPGAPMEIVSAGASFAEGRVVDPVVEVRNTGNRAITDFQIVWVFRDSSGMEFRGRTGTRASGLGSGRNARRRPPLGPGESASISESLVFEAERQKREVEIVSARVFVRAVEFAEGRVWVPERSALESLGLEIFLPPSSETTRLWHSYRQRGPQALMAELSR